MCEPLKLYLSPINIDPEKPSMPVSHPKIFSVYLAKLLGSFATLGMAEDTWSLNERVLSETKLHRPGLPHPGGEGEDLLQHPGQDKGRGWSSRSSRPPTASSTCSGATCPIPARRRRSPSQDPKVTGAILESYRRMDDFLEQTL